MTNFLSARRAAEAFCLPGTILDIQANRDGLIHDTLVVCTRSSVGEKRFILQRINEHVFPDLAALMENVERVVGHIQDKAIQAGRNPEREVPRLVRTKAGGSWLRADGHAWRIFRYVEGTRTLKQVAREEEGCQIGRAFGRFLDQMSDLSPQSLCDALPGYRNTEQYLALLWAILDQDPLNRGGNAREEIAFIEKRAGQAMHLQRLQRSGQLPLRIIHGDTKTSNVLLDVESGQGICAIDFDTVMPGLLLHDIGDCLRGMLVRTSEPGPGLSQHDVRMSDAVVSGFASSLSQPLSDLEWASIPVATTAISLELGARFLCDYLSGDVYFRAVYPEHNLHRAQQQFRLQQRIEASEMDFLFTDEQDGGSVLDQCRGT